MCCSIVPSDKRSDFLQLEHVQQHWSLSAAAEQYIAELIFMNAIATAG